MKESQPSETLERGRAAFERQAWREAHDLMLAADRQTPLAAQDVERLAMSARLIGNDAEGLELLPRAHQGFVAEGDVVSAARCAFWLGYALMFRGDQAQAGGWLARAQRLLDESGRDCVERGYVLIPSAIRCVMSGDFDTGFETFRRIAELGARFGDRSLTTLALHGQGRALMARGEIGRGAGLLDEAMVAVTSGEVRPIMAGIIYCSVIEACHEVFDMRRAEEWTAALNQWCSAQPDIVPFRGECMVHRTEIMHMRGDWQAAYQEALRACERLSRPSVQPAMGAALYLRAEIHRLRGEFKEAEEEYREAAAWRKPQPGMALLRLAQGQLEAARAAVDTSLDETPRGPRRSALLAAQVEIALAAKDVAAARAAADELETIAARFGAPLPRAVAAHAAGAVNLAQGNPRAALTALRTAWTLWRELDAPYEMARVGVRLAQACRALGDEDTARLELDAARRTFEELGAAPDLVGLEGGAASGGAKAQVPLTARELEVLALVAAGKSNKAIADILFISDKTVARHISNIFNKLDLPSRSAATAYAYQHGLV